MFYLDEPQLDQPQFPVAPSSAALNAGLIRLWSFGSGRLDLVTGKLPVVQNGTITDSVFSSLRHGSVKAISRVGQLNCSAIPEIQSAQAPFSIVALCKSASNTTLTGIANYRNGGDGWVLAGWNNGTIVLYSSSAQGIRVSTSYSSSTWTAVSLRYDGTTACIATDYGSESSATASTAAGSGNFGIGGWDNGGSGNGAGDVAILALFNSDIGENRARMFRNDPFGAMLEKQVIFVPSQYSVSTATLTAATYVPGSLTSTSVRPRGTFTRP